CTWRCTWQWRRLAAGEWTIASSQCKSEYGQLCSGSKQQRMAALWRAAPQRWECTAAGVHAARQLGIPSIRAARACEQRWSAVHPGRTSCSPREILPEQCNAQRPAQRGQRSEEHTSELQSLTNLVCRLLLE